jgi:cytochrome c
MSKVTSLVLALMVTIVVATAHAATASGDARHGAKLFRACAACHSLAPDRNMTGPSLAGIWGRKAGGLDSFERYSPALKAANVVWDEKSLDQWLKSPSRFIPQNRMNFAGMSDALQRADVTAFLKEASAGQMPPAAAQAMASQFQDLKKLGPDHQVRAIRYCHDTYHVMTADGESADFWEANLRFKTDSSDAGPLSGKPVIMPAGMMGDRASVFFAAPEEMSAFIKHEC